MSTATVVGPIRELRINQVLFVGESSIRTIQAAVNYAAADGGSFKIIIQPGYTGSESIASITNGSALIYLSDQRGASQQNYTWNGAGFIPAPLVQSGGIVATGATAPVLPPGSASLLFDPTGTSGNGSGDLRVLGENGKTTPPGFNLQIGLADGTAIHTFVRFDTDSTGAPRAQMPENTAITGNLTATGPVNAPFYQATAPASVAAEGSATIDYEPSNSRTRIVSRSANTSLGEFEISAASSIAAGKFQTFVVIDETRMQIELPVAIDGDLSVSGAITAAACEVDGSPVRTFENSPDGPGGMEWPPAGIGVSTGSEWAASIDPATVARTNAANTFTADQTFGGKISATAAVANLQLNPNGVGAVLLSWTGGTGGTHFGDGAGGDVGHVDSSGNAAFTGTLTALKDVGISGNAVIAGTLSAVGGNVRLTNSRALGTPFIYGDSTNLMLNSSAGGAIWIGLDSVGTTHFGTGGATFIAANGDAHFAGNLSAGGSGSFANGDFASFILIGAPNSTRLQMTPSSGSQYIDSFGPDAATQGTFTFRSQRSDGSGNIIIFTIDGAGNGHFAGDISAATKSFRIPHPLDATKDLVHSCLEGPEVAVFYRGEATVKTEGEVVLPDYFEALTRPEGRSVQLTQIFEDDGEVMIGSNVFTMLQASRVKDGKFRIRSNSTQSVKVYWEVKAVRADVPALVVEAKRDEPGA